MMKKSEKEQHNFNLYYMSMHGLADFVFFFFFITDIVKLIKRNMFKKNSIDMNIQHVYEWYVYRIERVSVGNQIEFIAHHEFITELLNGDKSLWNRYPVLCFYF